MNTLKNMIVIPIDLTRQKNNHKVEYISNNAMDKSIASSYILLKQHNYFGISINKGL